MSETERNQDKSELEEALGFLESRSTPGISQTVRERGKTDIELQACPFCGSASLTVERDEFVDGPPGDPYVETFYFVRCECLARGARVSTTGFPSNDDLTDEQAILRAQEKWNARA
jgi:hypothetical protein